MAHARNKAFWLVWSPQGNSPTHQHETRQLADREAERLARTNPGRYFIVLQAVSGFLVDNLYVTSYVEESADDFPF
jgi:hypothetical protein